MRNHSTISFFGLWEQFDFYVNKVIENNWSGVVLLNFLEADLCERQGQAITNDILVEEL